MLVLKQTPRGCSDCSRALVCASWWSWVSLKKFWRLAEQPPTWQHLWNGHHSSDPIWHRAHYRKILVKMKVSEAKSNFFKIEAYFASNAFVSFKNTPKRFQISFLGLRNAKFTNLKSKVKKSFLTKKFFSTFDFRMMNFAFLCPRNEIWKRLGVFLKLPNALDAKCGPILKKLDFYYETFIFTSIFL